MADIFEHIDWPLHVAWYAKANVCSYIAMYEIFKDKIFMGASKTMKSTKI